MDDKRNFKMLQPPKTRRSVEMTNQFIGKHLNDSLEQTPRPKATSTMERRARERYLLYLKYIPILFYYL